MGKDIGRRLLNEWNVGDGALDLAEKVYGLLDWDPNVLGISPSYDDVFGYGKDFLILEVELERDFRDRSEFQKYLEERDIPWKALFGGREWEVGFAFASGVGTSDAFYARFSKSSGES